MNEVVSYAEQIEELFISLYERYNVKDAPERRRPDVIDSFWKQIYNQLFKPRAGEEVKTNGTKTKLITCDIQNIEAITDMFIMLNKRFGGVIKLQQFSNLTGINKYTFYLWEKANKTNDYVFSLNDDDINKEYNNLYIIYNNDYDVSIRRVNNNINISHSRLDSLRFDCFKKLHEEIRDANTNGLSIDTMGQTIRANNDEDVGKLYEPRRMVQQETIRHAISVAELPKLSGFNAQLDSSPASLLYENGTQFKE